MKTVDFLFLNGKGEQVLMFTFSYDEQMERFTASGADNAEEKANNLGLFEGPIYGRLGKEFKPSDGLKYLEEMQYQFSGSRVRATAPYDL